MRLTDRVHRWLPWLLLAAAVIATAAVYWPGLTGGWVFDDYPNIVDNAAIHITPGHSTLVAWVNAALSSPASFLHRPLASITFALNWYSGGGDTWPFKLTNVVVHLINGVLLFCMLRALLRLMGLHGGRTGIPLAQEEGREWDALAGMTSPHRYAATPFASEGGKSKGATASPPPSERRGIEGDGFPAIDHAAATRLALLVSAAWLLLPINLMAVLYVVQRMESLCQVFVLAGLWAYLHGRWMMLTARDRSRETRGLSLAATGIVLGTLLGLTSKETAVLLPLFCFIAEAVVVRFPRCIHREELLSRRERGRDEGTDTRGGASLRESELDAGTEPSPGAARHPLPLGEGNCGEPLSRRERGRGEGMDTRGVVDPRNDGANQPAEPSPAPSGHLLPEREGNTTEPSPGAARHPLPLGEGNCGEPLSRRERGRGEGTDTRGVANAVDKRIWTLFTVTLFIPAVLGFLWLLRAALRASSWTGRDFTLGQRLLTEPRVLVDYLHWTIFPNPEVLSLYHDEIVKSTGILAPWTTLGAMLLLAALVAVAVLVRNRRPLVALGIGWFFAAQLLTATIIPLELVYEQRMYFASIGVLLAAGALLMGLRWRIRLPLLRGFIVGVALLWFAVATNLRAQEWSNPIRLAVAEANRHPESARAVYEAGRQLLIASNYREGPALTAAWKYLREAAAIQGSSALADQAMIMITDHQHRGDDDAFWDSMITKLRDQPTRQEDISALISLTNCYGSGICRFDVSNLQRAYQAALSRPHPIARLDGAYADFQRDLLHNEAVATKYLALAVAGDPSEPAYRVDLAALYARQGQTGKALEQIDALRRMNLAGRLDRQIAVLERLAEQGDAVKQ